MSERRSIDLHGRRVCVEIEGSGAPVLLLHGFTGDGRSWGGLRRRLARHFRVIAPDLVGHGKSEAPEDPAAYGMERAVETLVALQDALAAAPCHVLGYSMGGRLALHLCVRHPERVHSAVLIGASAGLEDPAAREERRRSDEALARAILEEGVPAFVARWERHPLFATQEARLSPEQREVLRSGRLAQRAVGLAGSLRGMGTGAQDPLHAQLPALRVPLLLLAGEDDPKFRAIARDLARRLPDARTAVVPQAGHAAHLESPADVAGRALSHFRSTERSQPMVSWKTMRDYEDIRLERSDDGIAKITICRPEVRNAFRPLTLFELIDAFARAREDAGIGVILFTGEGDQAFCSGGDQKVRGDAGYVGDDGVPRLNALDLQRVIRTLPKPVIALVAGYAIGGGHVLHLICDLTIAAENARFGQTGPKVGSFDAGFGASYLARVVGQKRAREIWYLCRQYDARRAYDMGLVNEVVPVEKLEETGVEWAREILAKSPLAIRCLKAAFNADCDGQAGLQELAGHATQLFYMTEEAQEGRDAFVEKRAPDFSAFPWRP